MLNSRAAALHQRINRNSTIYSALTFSHTGGLNMQTLPAVLQGSRIIISPRFSPSHFLKTIAEASHTILVPAHWQLIRKSQAWVDAHFPTLSVVTGSSPVPRSLIEDIQGHGARVLSVYGLTEVGPFVCFSEDSVALPPGVESCLGQPVEGYSMDISECGEILIKGPCIGKSWEEASGQLVSLANENGWLETGDLGLEQEGHFFFCGRKNLFINVGGFKVSPSEVEAVIMEIPGVTRTAVQPTPHPTWGEIPCAYIVGKNLTVEGVRRHLRKRLSSIKIPRKIELVSKVPETAIGKNNYRSMKSVKC
jgi:fatty-acyl-CoA synthase